MYKLEQKVYIKTVKRPGVIKDLTDDGIALVTYFINNARYTQLFKLDEIMPFRPKRKLDTVYFAKVRDGAKIPSKRYEDAGYDFYACFDDQTLIIPKGVPTLIPTGIASAMSSKYYLNLKHERGSTGKLGMSLLSGVVDSGYRNEILINITPLYKDIMISKTHTGKPVDMENVIIYPYDYAIAQGTLEYVPNVIVKEIPYEQLKEIPSERGMNGYGSTN